MAKNNGQSTWASGGYIGLSIALGAGFGVPFDNIPAGAAVGLLFGLAVTAWARFRSD